MEATDKLETLEEQLEETDNEPTAPEAWNPNKPGETLVGEVVDFDEDAPGSHGPCDVATIDNRDGERKALWLSNTVLKRKWDEQEPEPGDYVGVKYQGKNESSNGRTYKVFEVKVEKPNQ